MGGTTGGMAMPQQQQQASIPQNVLDRYGAVGQSGMPSQSYQQPSGGKYGGTSPAPNGMQQSFQQPQQGIYQGAPQYYSQQYYQQQLQQQYPQQQALQQAQLQAMQQAQLQAMQQAQQQAQQQSQQQAQQQAQQAEEQARQQSQQQLQWMQQQPEYNQLQQNLPRAQQQQAYSQLQQKLQQDQQQKAYNQFQQQLQWAQQQQSYNQGMQGQEAGLMGFREGPEPDAPPMTQGASNAQMQQFMQDINTGGGALSGQAVTSAQPLQSLGQQGFLQAQQASIPPEVLARYNNVNSASQYAQPQYGYQPSQGMNAMQRQFMANLNAGNMGGGYQQMGYPDPRMQQYQQPMQRYPQQMGYPDPRIQQGYYQQPMQPRMAQPNNLMFQLPQSLNRGMPTGYQNLPRPQLTYNPYQGTVNPTLNKQEFDVTKDPSKQYIWRQEAKAKAAAEAEAAAKKKYAEDQAKMQYDYDYNSTNQLGGKRGGRFTTETALRAAQNALNKGRK